MAKTARIGLLSVGADPERPVVWLPFLERLRELGYVEGRNVVIERRFAAGRHDRLPELVSDLKRLELDVVVATGTAESQAAKQALPGTPIVMMLVADPVGSGLVSSLPRPEGNVTGLSTLASGLTGKQVELLAEAVPGVGRVGLLLNPANPLSVHYRRETEGAARARGLEVHAVEVREAGGLRDAFAVMSRRPVQAVLVPLDALLFSLRTRVVALAATGRLPAMYGAREFVDAGGLMAYAPRISDLSRRAADFADKILRGARPADLPVEQPTRFELVINLGTARRLALTLPQPLRQRADHLVP